MLIVRPEQLALFHAQADAAFVGRVVDHLKENHADAAVRLENGAFAVAQLPDETAWQMVRNGIARARQYGLSWESSLTAFVVLMVVVAPNFDDHPLIQRVLKDDSVAPDARIERLWERTSEENWEAASQNYRPAAWNLSLPEE